VLLPGVVLGWRRSALQHGTLTRPLRGPPSPAERERVGVRAASPNRAAPATACISD
jgi:hypothetical protein